MEFTFTAQYVFMVCYLIKYKDKLSLLMEIVRKAINNSSRIQWRDVKSLVWGKTRD
jgi:hypothetical protein